MDKNTNSQPDSNSDNQAYDAVGEIEEIEEIASPQAPKNNSKSSSQWKRNFKSVFGSGIGKISLIMSVVVILVFLAFGIRGFSSSGTKNQQASIDVPNAPRPNNQLMTVTPEEHQRRAQQAALEAEQAKARGGSYQPMFDPLIGSQGRTATGTAQFPEYNNPQGQGSAYSGLSNNASNPASSSNRTTDTAGSANMNSAQQQAQQARAEQDFQQRRNQEFTRAATERDKYVATLRQETTSQIASMFSSSNANSGINAMGVALPISYYTPVLEERNQEQSQTEIVNVGSQSAYTTGQNTAAERNTQQPQIKTGNMMYASLMSEVNTDDGGDVLAKIHGGEWDGSIIIGKIEQANANIRLHFTILAPPKDDLRPTMTINAVALREEDLKQGVASDINNHVFSRYTSLAVSSLLTGYGAAYEGNTGTTIVTSGSTVQTNEDPSDKRVIANVVGEFGRTLGQATRKGFDRPPTYSTKAHTGFVLFFLSDVK